jgi:hypothetical protein
VTHDVDAYLAGKPRAAVELFQRFRALVLAAGECEERVHRTEVAWADRRVFASAFIVSGTGDAVIAAVCGLRGLLRQQHNFAVAVPAAAEFQRIGCFDERQPVGNGERDQAFRGERCHVHDAALPLRHGGDPGLL